MFLSHTHMCPKSLQLWITHFVQFLHFFTIFPFIWSVTEKLRMVCSNGAPCFDVFQLIEVKTTDCCQRFNSFFKKITEPTRVLLGYDILITYCFPYPYQFAGLLLLPGPELFWSNPYLSFGEKFHENWNCNMSKHSNILTYLILITRLFKIRNIGDLRKVLLNSLQL